MRDPVFSGDSVEAALTLAARTLGQPQQALRYVVLERERAAGRGLAAQPARIAVLPAAPAAAAPAPAADGGGLLEVVAALAAAAGVELTAELGADADGVSLQLAGSGLPWLLEQDAAAMRALEHVLRRASGRDPGGARLRLRAEGYADRRDQVLEEQARALAAAVRQDGAPRTTEPLNAYERRLVHMALSQEPGVRTFSVGEGAERRVTVARVEPETPQ